MKVLSIVGARPQFVKLAAINNALCASQNGVAHAIIHTGQHYDSQLSSLMFSELAIPTPDENLGIGSGKHGEQTGAMLTALERAIPGHDPDWVLVYGDTNSTLAGALAAVKLHIPTAHLEAGLRSFNRRMPEEHNRVMADHASDLCLAPTQVAFDQLAKEGLGERSVLVGDVMADVLLKTQTLVADDPLPASVLTVLDSPRERFLLATIHRAENTDDSERLASILVMFADLPVKVILPAHPRLLARCADFNLALAGGALQVIKPLGYLDMVRAVSRSSGVITDSGGLQKEAFLLGVPTTTVRAETEWPETLHDGWNILNPTLAAMATIALRDAPATTNRRPFGDGNAAVEVFAALTQRSQRN